VKKKKCFSLINGREVVLGPQSKVIPANEFSTILSAEEVLEKVKEDAENYRLQVVKECELIKEAAQNEGFNEGFREWLQHVAALEDEVIKVRKDLEKMLIPVALKAAKKIVGREIELSEDTIVDIVSNALKQVAQHKKVTIYVNPKDLDGLEHGRTRLRKIFESLEVLSLRQRGDISPGGCIIETEGGIINAQIENQWRSLEQAFERVMLHHKDNDLPKAKTEEKHIEGEAKI
jgi:type III secretion protein L